MGSFHVRTGGNPVSQLRWSCLVLLGAVVVDGPLHAQKIKLPFPVAELETRARADSTDAAAQYNVALGYWSEKRFDDAERALHTAVAIDQRFAQARLALAFLPYARRPRLYTELFRHEVPADQVKVIEQANREYRHAFLIDPLVDLRIIAAATPSSANFVDLKDYLGEAYALFYQGFADCEEGRYEDCHGRFAALIDRIDGERYPQRVPNSVLWYKGIAAAHVGKFDIATSHFRSLIGRNIDYEKELAKKDELAWVPLRTNEYKYTLATILQAAGKTAEAVPLFHEVLQADIGLYMAHVRLASIYEAQRDWPNAVQERSRAVDANPDDPSLLTDLGITLGKAGMMPQAETRFRAAWDANPRDVRPLFWLGLALMEQGKSDEAKQTLQHFLAVAPSRLDRQITMAKDRLAKLQ